MACISWLHEWLLRLGSLFALAALLNLPACGSTEAPPTSTLVAGTPAAAGQFQTSTSSTAADLYNEVRQKMVEQQIRNRDITNPEVLAAMTTVPRHEFVPADQQNAAYNDHPLPIGYGQTISQPYIVALMTELIDIQPGDKVLEIGTGSGYQAAILAELTDQVYTLEIIPELAEQAQQTFDRLGYEAIEARQGDGYFGWPEHAPFDAIIVTAAPDHIPQPLINQLADGGIMVIPIGPPGGYQSLWVLERQGEEIRRFNWGGVIFVPLTRE